MLRPLISLSLQSGEITMFEAASPATFFATNLRIIFSVSAFLVILRKRFDPAAVAHLGSTVAESEVLEAV